MKWFLAFAFVLVAFAANVRAEKEDESLDEEGDGRLGFVTVGSDGTTSVTFNATSIQSAVILGLFIVVLAALLIPLFGGIGGEDSGSGYGYGEPQQSYGAGSAGGAAYQAPASGYNAHYAKRSVTQY
jgi:hypothetical protein